MVNQYKKLLLLLALISLPALPVQAQDVAVDQPSGSYQGPGPTPGPGMMSQGPSQSKLEPHPQQASGMAGHDSNMQHWSRFSQCATSSPFVRVPAGTRSRNSVSHYVRPQWVPPGSVPSFAHSEHVKPTIVTSSNGKVVRTASNSASAKKANTQIMVMGYGKGGQVTYTPIHGRKWSGTAVSCYGRYN